MKKKDLRIIFMGTPDFAVATLQQLVNNEYNVVGVITMPDKPAGRGHKLQYSAVKEYALSQNLNILQPENLKDESFINTLRELNATLQIVVAFRMLPEIVWNMPSLGTFNLHASLLPQYRGAAPINWAIINGERYTGVTTFFLKQEIDTGEVILQEKNKILDSDNFGTVYNNLKEIGAKLVLNTLELILSERINKIPQYQLQENGELLKTAPKLFKDNCRINWNKPAREIFNFVRGLSPSPLAWTTLVKDENTLILKIGKSEVVIDERKETPGTIISDNKKYLYIQCEENLLSILEMQLPGKKMLPIKDILNGFKFENIKSLL